MNKNYSTVNFRIDSDLKKQFEETCENMGLSLTCAFTLFVNTVVRDGKIPFEITTGNSKKIDSSEV